MAKRQSARQKMINLMYLVFIAMMALNVSTEVLDGFDIVNENLRKAITNSVTRNNQLYGELKSSYESNPEKTEEWYETAQEIQVKTDSLFDYIEYLKLEIAIKSDGPEADVNNLAFRDNLDAASEVMLSPLGGQGKNLQNAIDEYRVDMISRINDVNKQALISHGLATQPSEKAKKDNKDWVHASFERMPSIAVLAYLTGIQASVKQAEGEALTSLLKNIDFADFRVNSVRAIVTPESSFVMSGTPYRAHISMAAVDTTQRPRIIVQGTELPERLDGLYTVSTSTLGTKRFSGYIEMMSRDGSDALRLPFSKEYTVIEPMATVAPLLMDVVYSGIDNPIGISVSGVNTTQITARATSGGTLTKLGDKWMARPGKVGGNFGIEVFAQINGKDVLVANQTFRIRELPDPIAFIQYADANGSPKKFKRGALSRSVVLNATGIKAAIDDGILDMPFQVLGFRTIILDAMGNALPEVSNGANFSAKQKAQIEKMGRGKSFFISTIRVKGPDGIEREISPMEVRLN